jgi:hypothetical protein
MITSANSTQRRSKIIAIGLGLFGAGTVFAAPSPAPKTSPSGGGGAPINFSVPSTAPAGTPAYTTQANAVVSLVPKHLDGVVTEEEFKSYLAFQNKLRDEPKVKALNEKIISLVGEMQKLQVELDAARKTALDSDPKAKAVGDKIAKATATINPVSTRPAGAK